MGLALFSVPTIVLPLVLVEAAEHANNHLARRGARVNAQVERPKVHAAVVEFLHQLNGVHRVAAESSQAVHYHHVAFPHGRQQLGERGAMSARTRHLFLKDARAARLGKVFHLRGQVLVGGGNAGVTKCMLHGSESMGHKHALRNPLLEPMESPFQGHMATPTRWVRKAHLVEPRGYGLLCPSFYIL